MKTSKNLKFQIPELDDQANITVIGSALEALDDAAGDALAMNGDASSAQVTFERATARENISSKDTLTTLMSKVSRWFADLKDAAFHSVANNLTTTASGYVLDARQGKALNDAIGKGTTQLGGLYFGQDSSGKWGYKTSANGTVNPFRNPTGTATAGDVLVGKTFANASNDSLTGTMPNRGSMTATLTPSGNNTATKTFSAGYYTGGTITASGASSYNAGVSAGKAAVGYGVEVFGGVGQYTNTNWTVPQTGKYRMTWLVHSTYTHSIYVYKGSTYYISHDYEDGKNNNGLSGGSGDTGWLSFNKGDVLTIAMNGDSGQKNGIASILTITYVYGN